MSTLALNNQADGTWVDFITLCHTATMQSQAKLLLNLGDKTIPEKHATYVELSRHLSHSSCGPNGSFITVIIGDNRIPSKIYKDNTVEHRLTISPANLTAKATWTDAMKGAKSFTISSPADGSIGTVKITPSSLVLIKPHPIRERATTTAAVLRNNDNGRATVIRPSLLLKTDDDDEDDDDLFPHNENIYDSSQSSQGTNNNSNRRNTKRPSRYANGADDLFNAEEVFSPRTKRNRRRDSTMDSFTVQDDTVFKFLVDAFIADTTNGGVAKSVSLDILAQVAIDSMMG